MLSQWLVNELGSGSVADYVTLPERYLWAKIAVAAGAPRSEADYISLPKNYVWKAIYDAVSGSSLGTIDWGEKQALGHIAAAYRGDTANPANLATYIDWPWRYQVASIITSLSSEQIPWTPSQITTSIWLDASDASTVSVSNGILTWNDKSGNSHNFTATSSINSPTYSGTRNGFNVINFDNETNWQRLENLTYTNNGTEIHLFSVHINTPTSGSSSYGRLFSMAETDSFDYDNNQSIALLYGAPFEDPDGICLYRNGSIVAESSAISGQWCIVDAQRNGNSGKISLNAEEYITGSTSTDNFNIGRAQIGNDSNHGDSGITGYIAEQIALNYIPTQSVVEKIQGYLAHKWGLAGSLPSSHPYKNAAPTL
jgi:hypothetical protein